MDNKIQTQQKTEWDLYTTTREDFLKYIKGKTKKDFELLMPAGSFEKAMYAIEFGADAIYCGIPMFTLRGKSTMSMDDLKKLVPYAHSKGVKVYFAVNIFPHSFKHEQFMRDMKLMVEDIKPDAFIMADPGLIDLTMEHFPSAEVHLSVQQNNVNWMSGRFWQKLGVARIVLARELTLREIQIFHEKLPDMEIEFFIHGSNCMAYSGRCMLSNYMNYRDSNQGVCNNACRFKYNVYKSDSPDKMEPLQAEGYKEVSKGTHFVEEQMRKGELYEVSEDETGTYIFNSKDNCMAEYIGKMMEAGVCSFKVEGRTKSVYYAAIVARTYRKLFDEFLSGKEPDVDFALRELNTTSNRGFMPGFLEGNPKDKSFDYEKKTSHQTHVFAGVVRNVISSSEGKSLLEIETRGNFKLGQTIEFLTPKTEFKWVVDKLIRPKTQTKEEKELQSVAGGLEHLVRIEVPFELDSKYCVIRRELSVAEIKNGEN